MSQSQTNLYRLHVANDGVVWYAIDQHMPVPVGMTVDTFVKNNPVSANDEVVVAGSRSNARLIVEMFQLKLAGKIKSLKICSPAACKGEKRRQEPNIVLMDLMQLRNVAGSLGGWHEAHATDAHAYYLAMQTTDAAARQALNNHPVYPYLGFIPNLDLTKCAQLVGGLIDPRWYVDPDEPESHSKIQGYLGLNPRTQHVVTSDDSQKAYAADRCRLVRDAWKTEEPDEETVKQPGYFLWRVYQHEGADYMAELRASQMFVSYLRETWLHEIYSLRGGCSKDGLFVPEYFFKTHEEIQGFKEFISKRKS